MNTAKRRDLITDYLLPDEHDRFENALDAGNWERLIDIYNATALEDPAGMFPDHATDAQPFLFCKAVDKYGGEFVKRLADAYLAADPDNQRKIRTTWPEYWIKYVLYGTEKEEK